MECDLELSDSSMSDKSDDNDVEYAKTLEKITTFKALVSLISQSLIVACHKI